MRRATLLSGLALMSMSDASPARADSPHPPSTVITNIAWETDTYRFSGSGGDIWPITWTGGGPLVTAWGDGVIGCPAKASYGLAQVTADLPSTALRTIHCGPGPMNRGKIMALVATGNTLYARLNLQNGSAGSPVWRSSDGGQHWTTPPTALPFLIESFVQFGKGNAGAPGGFVYALERRLNDISLLRVAAGSVQSGSAYEYFSGTVTAPAWSANRSSAQAIFSDGAGIQRPSITYVPGLDRYLLAVAHSQVENPSSDKLALYESKNVYGPWSTVERNDNFLGMPGGHFLGMNFPIKWQSPDGRTLWATFSCHDNSAPGSCGQYHDRFNMMKVTLTVQETTGDPADGVGEDDGTDCGGGVDEGDESCDSGEGVVGDGGTPGDPGDGVGEDGGTPGDPGDGVVGDGGTPGDPGEVVGDDGGTRGNPRHDRKERDDRKEYIKFKDVKWTWDETVNSSGQYLARRLAWFDANRKAAEAAKERAAKRRSRIKRGQ